MHHAHVIENWGSKTTRTRQLASSGRLLSYQKVVEFNKLGANVADGAFGENLLVDGIDCRTLPIGTKLKCGDVLLEVTQIGKECHSGCAIFKRVGTCIMPHEGIFARVLHGGDIQEGDTITTVEE